MGWQKPHEIQQEMQNPECGEEQIHAPERDGGSFWSEKLDMIQQCMQSRRLYPGLH